MMAYPVHLNWSGYPDYLEARARLYGLVSVERPFIRYGNFADVWGDPAAIKKELEKRGFIVREQTPGRYERACFCLYKQPANKDYVYALKSGWYCMVAGKSYGPWLHARMLLQV